MHCVNWAWRPGMGPLIFKTGPKAIMTVLWALRIRCWDKALMSSSLTSLCILLFCFFSVGLLNCCFHGDLDDCYFFNFAAYTLNSCKGMNFTNDHRELARGLFSSRASEWADKSSWHFDFSFLDPDQRTQLSHAWTSTL